MGCEKTAVDSGFAGAVPSVPSSWSQVVRPAPVNERTCTVIETISCDPSRLASVDSELRAWAERSRDSESNLREKYSRDGGEIIL